MKQALIGLIVVCSTSMALGVNASSNLDAQRTHYQQALAKQQQKDWQGFEQQRKLAGAYPLKSYLDYQHLSAFWAQSSDQEVLSFLSTNQASHLNNRIQRRYLLRLAGQQRWADMLEAYPQKPNNVDLQCYYHYAQLKTGQAEQAWLGAKELWAYGKSRPKACDGLFKAWNDAGQRSSDDVWQRMLLAFKAREKGLMDYLGRQLPSAKQAQVKALQSAYAVQTNYLKSVSKIDSDWQAELVDRSLQRLAWVKLDSAYEQWQRLYPSYKAYPELADASAQQLIRAAISSKQSYRLKWADQLIELYPNDNSIERRLRLSVEQQNWAQIRTWYPLLSDTAQQIERWRFWYAWSLNQQNANSEPAAKILLLLAQERSYYGFLASDTLGSPYQLRAQRHQVDSERQQLLVESDDFKRVQELQWQGQAEDARAEWRNLLSPLDKDQRLDLGEAALERGWDDLAVQSSIIGKYWDQLELRFPYAFQNEFTKYSKQRQLPESLLMAVARQESAMYSKAYSSAGARGLMQLMPATAKETARKNAIDYNSRSQLYEAETNIGLGSAYLKELMQRYKGNRILSAAAYNAGPHRVQRWLAERGNVPGPVWVETIPFHETRGYVQSVLAYQIIYSRRDDKLPPLMSEAEKANQYQSRYLSGG
ncbi:hypothetical protein DBZ36_09520 [Alginatibacterium sediminis]|uniref:Lytic murein transglycosylase n=1 Tax=Alginatibacterium sediminis TaxID=2164068 RepID=A0A420ED88_9ALTE|nr:transglycosylase SLT domain-containing protein [Alginatibacterium sediminis]RKF18635.1 hypothetical protein DBZ36_09520 [Alginatibacterium sediminis]